MTRLLITGATLADGTGADVLVEDGTIREVGTVSAPAGLGDDERVAADGLVLLPGFVDLHTHLREPGGEEAETVETGTRAAARGGFTAVHAMANTTPVADTAGVVEQVARQGEAAGLVAVHPSGCITVGRAGEQLAPYAELVAAGVHLFTDDGFGVHLAFFDRTPGPARVRLLEGRRRVLEERREGQRDAAARTGPTELRYARQLTLLGLETSERELRWINELIRTENPSQGEPQ